MILQQNASNQNQRPRRGEGRYRMIAPIVRAHMGLAVGMLLSQTAAVMADGPATAVAANRPATLTSGPGVDIADGRPSGRTSAPGRLVAFDEPKSTAARSEAQESNIDPQALGRGDELIESIQTDRIDAQRIRVSKNSTAVINLTRNADAIQIADPTIADCYLPTPTRIVVSGKNYGSTQLLMRVGDQQKTLHIDVELDLSALNEFIKSVSPTARVVARSINGTIMLTGVVPDAEAAQQIQSMAGLVQGGEVRSSLTVAGVQQTMLRVVVAEVNKEASRQLGVNWAVGAADWSRDFFFANNVANINPTVFGSSGVPNVLNGQQLYSVAPVGNGPNTNITFGFPKAEFQVFLNALRENGLARTLAEPNLVAISGQTATFLAGGEVPIPVAQAGASAGAITVEYREFGVRLGFTPSIMAGQIIRLHVMSEVSEAVPTTTVVGGFPLFTFTTRRVESTVECGNGQTFAIAGLLNDRIRANASKIPGLGDLPVLGAMFSSTAYERSMTELVVLVTPQLVEPLDPQQVPPAPGSLMTEPTDFELFGLQKLEGEPLARPESDSVPRENFPAKTRPGGTSRWPTTQFALRGPWGLAEFEEK